MYYLDRHVDIGTMTLSIMTLSIMTLSIMTLSIMTLSIMTLSITTLSHINKRYARMIVRSFWIATKVSNLVLIRTASVIIVIV
jgi:hypothetical protein